MTTRKRNEFLDPISSEDEGSEADYDSDAAEETKGRNMKRRRTDPTRGFLDNDDEDDDEDGEGGSGPGDSDEEDAKISRSKGKGKKAKGKADREDDQDDDDDDEGDEDDEGEKDNHKSLKDQYLDMTTKTPSNLKPLKPKPLDKTKPPKKNKTGVIYFSSLPPYLRPFALKSMLETRGFSPITKVFLSPAVPSPSAPRRRSNKRKTYSDGWVEFASKKTAKICAETLNASIVGGKKGGWYHDDVWNMKYLRGFKWADLMEQVQREKSEREAKRRVEDSRAKKEDKVFVSGVEKGKVLDGMQKKNEEKKKRNHQPEEEQPQKQQNVRRLFKQNEVKTPRDKIKEDPSAVVGDDTKRVLGKIF